jgi:hypothetical protein
MTETVCLEGHHDDLNCFNYIHPFYEKGLQYWIESEKSERLNIIGAHDQVAFKKIDNLLENEKKEQARAEARAEMARKEAKAEYESKYAVTRIVRLFIGIPIVIAGLNIHYTSSTFDGFFVAVGGVLLFILGSGIAFYHQRVLGIIAAIAYPIFGIYSIIQAMNGDYRGGQTLLLLAGLGGAVLFGATSFADDWV